MTNREFQCRICANLNSEVSQSIFKHSEGNLLRHIEQLTGIMLMNLAYLPQRIYSECIMDLRQARAFRRRCIKSQIYFTTAEYKIAARKKCDEQNQKQIGNIKAEQDNFVETTTIENQCNNESIEATEYEFLYDVEDDHLSHENSINLDANCEQEISNAASINHVSNSGQSKFLNDKVGTQQLSKKRSAAEYMCEECGKIYNNFTGFRTHLNRHAGIKPFPCENCPSKFSTKSELKLHSITHTGERPFECEHCGRCYATYGARIAHERLHTNEQPYKCTYCPKGFRRLVNLKDHLLTHTKERKFECTICEKSFQRRTHLAAHNRSQFHQGNVAKLVNLNDVDCEVII